MERSWLSANNLLFLGRDAFDQARAKIQSVQQELARWREMSVSIGFVDERRMAA